MTFADNYLRTIGSGEAEVKPQFFDGTWTERNLRLVQQVSDLLGIGPDWSCVGGGSVSFKPDIQIRTRCSANRRFGVTDELKVG